MTARTSLVIALAVLLLLAGCSAATRHKTLSFFFDGVPEPKPKAAAGTTPKSDALPNKPSPAGFSTHAPYAGKQCDACHRSAATNALVAEGEKLCLTCHEMKLDSPSVHTAISTVGCAGCHDPHTSKYPHLLAAEGDAVCFACHDKTTLEMGETHHGREASCVTCHDPHVSANKNLLR